MRVIFLFAHLHKGGMQKVVSNLSLELPDSISQYIVYFGTSNPDFQYKGRMVNLNVPGGESVGIFQKISNYIKRWRYINNFIVNEKIDLCISHGDAANIMNILARCPSKVLTQHVHITTSHSGLYGGLYKLVILFLYRFVGKFVTVSKALSEELVKDYGVKHNNVKVIHNPFDIEKIRSLSWEPVVDQRYSQIIRSDAPYVISVTSLIPHKGNDHLLRAYAIAARSIPELRLVFVGEGEEMISLQNEADELGLGSVYFTGFVANPYPLMARSAVFVSASHLEGLPTVLIEAMICGTPVIATDCPTGPNEILGNSEYGVLVDHIDDSNQGRVEAQIADWIVSLVNTDKGEHYKEQGSKRCLDFSVEKIVPQWLEVIKSFDTDSI